MNLKAIYRMSSLVTLFAGAAALIQFLSPGAVGVGGLQAYPQTAILDAGRHQSANLEVPGFESGKPSKLQRWSGNLVDVVCMTSALREVPPLVQFVYPLPPSALPRSMVNSRSTQPGPGPEAGYPLGNPSPPGQPDKPVSVEDEPEVSKHELEMQAADLKRAKVLDHAVKTCTPKTPTAHFGLLVSGEHLLKFDTQGDLKALQALRSTVNQPGKTVKAKVAGVIEAVDTVRVASIEIKSRIPAPEILSESRPGW